MILPPLKPRESAIDWPLALAVMGLLAVGAVFVASATLAREGAADLPWYRLDHFRQLVWYGVGLGGAVAVCLVDYRVMARWAMVGYWVSVALLVAVLFVGTSHGWGARRWLDLGPIQFQPSEISKLALLLALANYLSRPEPELRQSRVFLTALGLTLLPFLLILKEPDLGSALVFLPVGLVMMFVAGVPGRYLWRVLGGAGAVVVLLLVDILLAPPQWQLKLEPYQRRRLQVYFGVASVPPSATEAERQRALKEYRDAAHNVAQAMISVGSGGLTGKGWRRGTQNALGYLPRAVAHNDFIFSVIAEESGFVGSMTVLALYTVVFFSGVRIAGQARDRLGRLIAVGVVALLFCHVFINIGMNIRLTPVTGIPLPLLSYGGTSVMCSLIAAGLLQNVYRYRNHY
ncbi:MAG TPA: rod shape-determining protein RodA [Verrucomicrobiota bacterium]|nr:rod shape-determining protein RodA [Verrucomicrobiota bacterium]HNU49599.1 rod shape-determining protein RodA [Verrucomicrobiota bacterium]